MRWLCNRENNTETWRIFPSTAYMSIALCSILIFAPACPQACHGWGPLSNTLVRVLAWVGTRRWVLYSTCQCWADRVTPFSGHYDAVHVGCGRSIAEASRHGRRWVAWSWWRWVPNPKICNFSWIHGSFGADGQHFSHGKLTRALQFRHKMKKGLEVLCRTNGIGYSNRYHKRVTDRYYKCFFVVVNVGS
jgi:hypothetical protein